jgi:thiamine-phosphate pyrophosphorylase
MLCQVVTTTDPTEFSMQNALFRILDANLDRAREGLRVIEEWCRFGLNDAALTEECKDLRQALGQWHRPEFRAARDTAGDPGTELTHAQESVRSDINHVLQANLCRVEESLRVLEEYGKLYSADMAMAIKRMRYQVYILDSELAPLQKRNQLLSANLYLVTSPEPNLIAVVESALKGGLKLVQYRDKDADNATRYDNARQIKQLCQKYNAIFIVNDHIDVAIASDADGVHLGQQDFPMEVARRLLGPDKIVGRSTTNPQELQRAIDEKADYIGVGPVFETPTKPGKSACGEAYLQYVQAHAPMPWYAIGGGNVENLDQVLAWGAKRVSVVRSIMQASDPTLTTQQLIAKLS